MCAPIKNWARGTVQAEPEKGQRGSSLVWIANRLSLRFSNQMAEIAKKLLWLNSRSIFTFASREQRRKCYSKSPPKTLWSDLKRPKNPWKLPFLSKYYILNRITFLVFLQKIIILFHENSVINHFPTCSYQIVWRNNLLPSCADMVMELVRIQPQLNFEWEKIGIAFSFSWSNCAKKMSAL